MKQVLLVDDLESELKLIKSYLEKGGYSVTTATSAAEALEKLKEQIPHVIITDLVMPEMSGLELCRKLKKSAEMTKIPIIACSVKDKEIDQKWAKKQGVTSYLIKPCTQEQVLEAVASVSN